MTIFTPAEIDYLKGQRLGRLATVSSSGSPHVTPVGTYYDVDADALAIGSPRNMAGTKKFRDAQRHPEVAIVIDDVVSTDPWTPRGIEIRGHAETHAQGGEQLSARLGLAATFKGAWIRVIPQRVRTWGIESDSFTNIARNVA